MNSGRTQQHRIFLQDTQFEEFHNQDTGSCPLTFIPEPVNLAAAIYQIQGVHEAATPMTLVACHVLVHMVQRNHTMQNVFSEIVVIRIGGNASCNVLNPFSQLQSSFPSKECIQTVQYLSIQR